MGEILLKVVITAAVVLAIVLYFGFWFSLPGVIRSFLGTDTRASERYAREKAEQAEQAAEYQALKEELDRQLELANALQAKMNSLSPPKKLSQHERDLAARSQSPIDVTKMPSRPLAKLRRHEARMRKTQD